MTNPIRVCVTGTITDTGTVELLTEISMYMYLICLLYEEHEAILTGFTGGITHISYLHLKSMFWYNTMGPWEIFHGKPITSNKHNISGLCFNTCNTYIKVKIYR